jgi:hypothetical protein
MEPIRTKSVYYLFIYHCVGNMMIKIVYICSYVNVKCMLEKYSKSSSNGTSHLLLVCCTTRRKPRTEFACSYIWLNVQYRTFCCFMQCTECSTACSSIGTAPPSTGTVSPDTRTVPSRYRNILYTQAAEIAFLATRTDP